VKVRAVNAGLPDRKLIAPAIAILRRAVYFEVVPFPASSGRRRSRCSGRERHVSCEDEHAVESA
jgi:hypothetical protein